MTSNEHYGLLNDRFEVRSRILRNLGFRYEHVEGFDMAVFVRPRPGHKVPVCVPAAFVMHADYRCWSDRAEELIK